MLADADREHNERQIFGEEAVLEGGGGVVVEEAGETGFADELELAGEKDTVGELLTGGGGECEEFAGRVVADGGEGRGPVAVGAGPGGVAFGFGGGVRGEGGEFGGALEIAGVDGADVDKDKVFEGVAEEARDVERGVEAET